VPLADPLAGSVPLTRLWLWSQPRGLRWCSLSSCTLRLLTTGTGTGTGTSSNDGYFTTVGKEP